MAKQNTILPIGRKPKMTSKLKKTIKLIMATKNKTELTDLYRTIAYQVIMKEEFSKEEVKALQQIVAVKMETFGVKL